MPQFRAALLLSERGIYMIKKVFSAFATVFVIAIGCSAGVSADAVIGDLYRTDTFAYIDTQLIPVYSYNNLPYVVAEDLEGYGFDVKWNQSEQTLYLNYNEYKNYYPYERSDYYSKKIKVGKVYDSGVKVKLDGNTITSYSLDGRMLIGFDELWRYGKVNWYPESKVISATTRNFMENNPDWETLLPSVFLCERLGNIFFNIDDAYDMINEFDYNSTILVDSDFFDVISRDIDSAKECFKYISNDKYLYERGNLYHLAYNVEKYAEVYKEIANYINGKTPHKIYGGTWFYNLYDRSDEYYYEVMERLKVLIDTVYKYINRDVIPYPQYYTI